MDLWIEIDAFKCLFLHPSSIFQKIYYSPAICILYTDNFEENFFSLQNICPFRCKGIKGTLRYHMKEAASSTKHLFGLFHVFV